MTGCEFHMCRQIFVYTHGNLTGSDIEAVMLEYLLLLILVRNLISRLHRIEILNRRIFKIHV